MAIERGGSTPRAKGEPAGPGPLRFSRPVVGREDVYVIGTEEAAFSRPRPPARRRARQGQMGPKAVEVDGGLHALIDGDERVAVELDECWRKYRPHERPYGGTERALAAGKGVAEVASHVSAPSALVRVAPAESSTKAAAQRAVSWAMRGAGRGRRARVPARPRRSRRCGVPQWRPVSPTGSWRPRSVQPAAWAISSR